MFKVYTGEIKTGRLQRLAYLGYSVLLSIIVMAVIFGAIAFVGSIENLASGDLQQTQQQLMQNFGVPAMIAFGIFGLLVIFAHVNIVAKRFRDMGLPGWWAVLALIVLAAIVGAIFHNPDPEAPATVPTLINAVTWIVLLFVPSNAFSKDS